ncbi:MAG: efflux RND transporter periplasmic adaptor subunit [Tannerella sp.]|nr:efflux RND transporter periplasmic adaptor subunit [Tannerella sp.]
MYQKLAFANAEYKPVVNELKTFGKITADPDKTVDVFPAVGGNVSQVNAQLGDYVQKGQILAVFQSTEAAGYRKDFSDAQANLLEAQKNLQVANDMYQGKLATEKDVISAQKEVENAKTEIERIKQLYLIYNLGENAAYYVKAPISGFVTAKNITPDMLIRSDRGESLFTISQINNVWVMANISESNISQIRTNCEADIQTLSYPDRIIHGRVDRIFNIINPDTKSMQARIQLENPGYVLKPEMNATVTLKIKEGREMLTVPSKAIIFDNTRNYVLVYHSHKHIDVQAVEVYSESLDFSYIQSGIKAGDKIISKNALLVYRALTGN